MKKCLSKFNSKSLCLYLDGKTPENITCGNIESTLETHCDSLPYKEQEENGLKTDNQPDTALKTC